MAIALVGSIATAQADDNPTTTGFDTAGANFLLIGSGDHTSGGGGTGTDNKGNGTYTGLTVPGGLQSLGRPRLHYATGGPTVGSGHTFTFSGSGVFAGVAGLAFSGVHASVPFDVEGAGGTTGSSLTVQPGSVTPSQAGSLIVTLVCFDAISGGFSINQGFSTPVLVELNGTQRGIAVAYLIQGAAAAVNPTWTSVNNNAMTAVIAVFAPAATGSASVSPSVSPSASVSPSPSPSVSLSPSPSSGAMLIGSRTVLDYD